MNILVCNAGSTSLKFKLYDMPSETIIAQSRIERVGNPSGGLFTYEGAGVTYTDEHKVISDYRSGITAFLEQLIKSGAIASVEQLDAVGFKTVLARGHLGVHIIDDAVLKGMEDMLVLAPAHNRHYLAAIRTFKDILPDVPMVGAFETAFHQTMPPEAYIYSGPYDWYEKYGIRRFGYHGASHSYVAYNLNRLIGKSYRAVSCHLGGSCSLCAIVDGKSVDTSFGLSLQTGLPHNNRAGDIDPYIIFYLNKVYGLSLDEIEKDLQSRSGLLGISGVSGDLRDVQIAAEAGNARAKLAVDIFCHELIRYIGSYAAIMGGLDAIAFTGGIGENSAEVRDFVMKKLAFLGMVPSSGKIVRGEICCITAPESKVAAWVIPANEELGIARLTAGAIQ